MFRPEEIISKDTKMTYVFFFFFKWTHHGFKSKKIISFQKILKFVEFTKDKKTNTLPKFEFTISSI